MQIFALVINLLVILWVIGGVFSAYVTLQLYPDHREALLILIILAYAGINLFTIFRLKPQKDIKSNEKDNNT
jgi:hypothetical protein